MISQSDIEKLAQLARIELTEEEKQKLAPEIDAILGYVAQIQKISSNTETQPVLGAVKNIIRTDVALNEPSSHTQDILAEAPHREGDYVTVQKIIAQ